jgi:drug/metabolite transporter (DMT)-like permease
MTSRSTLAGVVYAVFWSSGFIGAELGTRWAPGLELLMWRYLIAAPLLVLACLALGARTSRRALGHQVVLGVLCQVAYLGPVVSAVGNGVSAGTAALVAALQPMVVAVAAGPLLGERVRRAGWLGLVVGFAGVGCVVAGDLSAGTGGWWLLGPVAGMLALSVGTLLGRHWEPPSSLLVSITIQSAVAAVGFTVLNVSVGTVSVPHEPGFWGAVAWTIVLSTFGGYGSYLFVLRTQGATRASTWLYLSPPITMVWAWLMFGDTVGAAGLAGVLVTSVGVALVVRGSGAPPQVPRLSEPVAVRSGG